MRERGPQMAQNFGRGGATKPYYRVWNTLHPDGEALGVRVVQLADGRIAYMPERLYIEVAPDGDGTTVRDLEGHRTVVEMNEHGEQIVEGSAESFTKGRQVVIDADTTPTGGIEMRAVTIFRADGPVRSGDLRGLRIDEYAETGLRHATGWLSSVIPTGVVSTENIGKGRLIGREAAELARRRPPRGRGRRKPASAVAFAYEKFDEGNTFGAIRNALREELGIDRSERTIRRWISEREVDNE
jgi:hypothetical protein